MWRTFIQMTALTLTIGAAFFLARANLKLSPGVIAGLAVGKWDYSSDVVEGA